jgi:hypothetical protein
MHNCVEMAEIYINLFLWRVEHMLFLSLWETSHCCSFWWKAFLTMLRGERKSSRWEWQFIIIIVLTSVFPCWHRLDGSQLRSSIRFCPEPHLSWSQACLSSAWHTLPTFSYPCLDTHHIQLFTDRQLFHCGLKPFRRRCQFTLRALHSVIHDLALFFSVN